MRTCLSGLTLVASLALLSACSSGGGGSSNPPPPPPNVPPVASAGPAQAVSAGALVTLNGSGSNDPDGSIASYAWTQTVGTAVTLSSTTTAQPTFTAPAVATATTLTFSLTVTDNRGATSPASTVNVTVDPLAAGSITGRVQFVRIPFGTATNAGLNYGNPQNQPARGVTVRAFAAGTTTPALATTVTDENGDYALAVAPNASVDIQVVAEMVRTGTPSWNFTVRDLPAPPDPIPTNPLPDIHTYTDPTPITAGTGPKNVLIPSGFNASGTVTGTRASASFAILDTLYQGVALVLSAAPNTEFPALVVDWGPNNLPADGTFFTSATVQHMVLTADVANDTDEFDQHVIAHEFGHYIEFNFSRADNIGGTHGIGDKLDPRVSFGEGFGYAFGAMVLNQPVTRDSFVESGLGCPNNQCSSTFNVETNPPTAPPGVNGNYGCWCSESSVWSILWDVYDQVPDANDTVTLGFIPMWTVLTGAQRNTPAFTTIFSFITALKTQNASSAAAIDTLVTAQNINSTGIDAFATNENNAPTDTVPQIAALPVYATGTVGGAAVVLRTVDDAGPTTNDTSGNKLGNHRYIRFTSPGGQRTITATSTNPNNHDVDLLVFRLVPPFQIAAAGTEPPAANEVVTFNSAAADYLIDVYDCANGCDESEGTPGDYDITVTIQ
jgi:hypothetical protein